MECKVHLRVSRVNLRQASFMGALLRLPSMCLFIFDMLVVVSFTKGEFLLRAHQLTKKIDTFPDKFAVLTPISLIQLCKHIDFSLLSAQV